MTDYGQRMRGTATYASEERETVREYFDANDVARRLEPSEEFMRVITKGVVALSSHAHLPAPEKYLSEYFGIDIRERPSPADYQTTIDNSTALKLVWKLRDKLVKEMEDFMIEQINVDCPTCGTNVDVKIGFLPYYDRQQKRLLPVHGPAPIDYEFNCDCVLDKEEAAELHDSALETLESET